MIFVVPFPPTYVLMSIFKGRKRGVANLYAALEHEMMLIFVCKLF